MKLPLVPLLLFGAALFPVCSSFSIVVDPTCNDTATLQDEYFYGSLPSDDGSDTSSGLRPENTPVCYQSISFALRQVSSNTTLEILPGTHYIDDFVLLRDTWDISIMGLGMNRSDVEITCAPGIGIAVLNVSNFLIQNLVIKGCNLSGMSLTNTLALLTPSVAMFFRYPNPESVGTGLFLGHCRDVTIQDITIANVNGFGLLGINVIGNSQLSGVKFISNGLENSASCNFVESQDEREIISVLQTTLTRQNVEQYGSGAVFLYQDFNDSYDSLYRNRRFTLDVESALFHQNRECSLTYQYYLNPKAQFLQDLGSRIGGGGGLTLILAQRNYSIDVTVKSTTFVNNTAIFGGSVQAVLLQGVHNTHVVFDNCTFSNNGAPEGVYIGNTTNVGAAGIAVFIDVAIPNQDDELASQIIHDRNSSVKVQHSTFHQNRAQYGGAMYVFSGHASAVNDISDVFFIIFEKCTFKENEAFLGSVVSVSDLKLSGTDIGIQLHIIDTDFIQNQIQIRTRDGSVSVSQDFGTIDIRSLNVTFYGNCLFVGNEGTALRAYKSLIGIAGNVTFNGNSGLYGGAFYLLTLTYVVMAPNSSLYLLNNQAQLAGGAFFVNEAEADSFTAGGGFYYDCFLYFSYDEYFLCSNCSDLNSTGVYIKFAGNVAPSGSDVYGSALYSCPWALGILGNETDRSTFQILHDDFPNVFDFDERPDRPELVQSIPAQLVIDNREDLPTTVAAGETFNISIATYDDFGQIVSAVISSFVAASDFRFQVTLANSTAPRVAENNFGVLVKNSSTQIPVTIFGLENQELVVVVYSVDVGRRAQTSIPIKIVPCGFGFDYDRKQSTCVCRKELEDLEVKCDTSTHTLIVRNGLWVGPVGDDSIGVHECVFQFCEAGTRQIRISNDTASIRFDIQCDVKLFRTGILCGACLDGYSITLGSQQCRVCDNFYILLFIVFLLVGCLIIVLIRYLRITITGGYLNGVIFYSNIVSLYGINFIPNTEFKNLFIVSLPTLNLGFETCLYDGMGSLERVWWQLSFPIYLFILMGLTTLLARSKYFKTLSGTSTIQTFATLLIVCYVSVLQASAELIGFVRIRTDQGDYYTGWSTNPAIRYFSAPHAPLAILAILLAIFYLIPLPLFLLFPTLIYRNRFLSKYKPIYDAFWEPFERDYRFWLGFRLIFRWIPFIVVFTVRPPINIFITGFMLLALLFVQLLLKPFKSKWTNIVDSCFLLNLVAIFMGSLFFYAQSEFNLGSNSLSAERSGYIYVQILIVLGFLGLIGVLLYYTFIRFPKLKMWLLKTFDRRKKRKRKYHISPTKDDNETNRAGKKDLLSPHTSEDSCSSGVFSEPSRFTTSELREPLLESGTVEFVTVSTSTVPTSTVCVGFD